MKKLILLTLLFLLIIPVVSADESFINWRAGYYVMYPDDWYHVSYRTVNIFLTSQDITFDEFDYDAVLALMGDKPFFEMPYIFLSHVPVGKFSETQIDSAVASIARGYGRMVVNSSLKEDRVFNLNQPVYDSELKTLAVKSRVTSEYTDKMLLEITRFYEKGIAFFLCYAPKEMYNDARPTFLKIMNSFSTKDIDKLASKDSLKVVDLSERELAGYDESEFPEPDSKNTRTNWQRYIFIFLLLILVFGLVGLFVFRKKKTGLKIDT